MFISQLSSVAGAWALAELNLLHYKVAMLLAAADLHPPGAFQTHGPICGKRHCKSWPTEAANFVERWATSSFKEGFWPPEVSLKATGCVGLNWFCCCSQKGDLVPSAQWCFLPHKWFTHSPETEFTLPHTYCNLSSLLYESVFCSCVIHQSSCQGFFLPLTTPHPFPACSFCSTVSQTRYFQEEFWVCTLVSLLLG